MVDPFTPGELKLISQLLGMASETYSNHGCNDFELKATEANHEIMRKMYAWNSEDQYEREPEKKIMTYDWMLMDYLAARCMAIGRSLRARRKKRLK